jgi:hypothetical protein
MRKCETEHSVSSRVEKHNVWYAGLDIPYFISLVITVLNFTLLPVSQAI